MPSKKRRYEVMLPVAFNDGRPVPKKWFGKALRELVEQFGGVSFQSQPSEGEWLHEGIVYRDKHVKITVDVPDSPKNRRWMREFKERWRFQLKQIELWMVTYLVEVV
jgi:hypothetical protein